MIPTAINCRTIMSQTSSQQMDPQIPDHCLKQRQHNTASFPGAAVEGRGTPPTNYKGRRGFDGGEGGQERVGMDPRLFMNIRFKHEGGYFDSKSAHRKEEVFFHFWNFGNLNATDQQHVFSLWDVKMLETHTA